MRAKKHVLGDRSNHQPRQTGLKETIRNVKAKHQRVKLQPLRNTLRTRTTNRPIQPFQPVASIQHSTVNASQNAFSNPVEVLKNQDSVMECEKPILSVRSHYEDPMSVPQYVDDIIGYMRELEVQVAPSPNYMSIQTELTWDMRGILVDWIVQVHQRFRLLPETLFLTVHLIDRFLSIKSISSSKLQLVGVVSLLIAAKMEEQYAPTIDNLAFMTDNAYTKKDIVKAEQRLLVLMGFDIRYAQPMTFLRRISNADTLDSRIRNLAKYLMEATLMDYKFVSQLPSFVAAASMCVARKVVMDGEWTTEHVRLSGYQEYELIDCGRAILKLVSDIESHKSIYTKYSHEHYSMVSIEMRHFLLRTGFVKE